MIPPGWAVRRIVDPVLRRHVALRTSAELYEPRDTVAAVRAGIAELTAGLAAEGRWPGLSPAQR